MKEEAIFWAALKKSTPAERDAFLDQACEGNSLLRDSVEQLILAHDRADRFLETPAVRPKPGGMRDAAGTKPGHVEGNGAQGTQPFDVVRMMLQSSEEPGVLGTLGPYAISQMIGRGGMGLVFKAHDPKLNRIVAIKVLAPEWASNVTARKRFLREAQAAAAVSHQHVVTTHAIDETPDFPYIVMEYVAGRSLQDRIDREGPLAVKQVVRIARQTALGLTAAHEQGLIHRDIKPANILLENGIERVKLSDFGVARTVDDASTTQSGILAGTPQYMSPEQARGERVDGRSDLFSLGSVMYAMLTGRCPFRSNTTMAALRRVCTDQPRPLDQLNPDAPRWLIAIIERLMAKNPDDRFQSAAEVAEVLGRCLQLGERPSEKALAELERTLDVGSNRSRQQAVPDAASPRPTSEPPPASVRPGKRDERRPSRKVLMAATIAVLLCALLGVVEATGVSHVRDGLAAVLRIWTPHGTLAVEVDDPAVSVAIEGEDVVITGAGPREVRLKPGRYRLRALKDGELVAQELVTVSSGGKQVVKIDFEPSTPADQAASVTDADANTRLPQFRRVARLVRSADAHYAACFHPTNESVLTWADGGEAARLLRIPDGRELRRFAGRFGAAAFAAETTRLVTGSYWQQDRRNELVVWDTRSSQRRWTSPPVSGVFHDLAVSPDGSLAVSAHGQWWGEYQDRDHAVRIWDLQRQQLRCEIRGHSDQVTSVALRENCRHLVSGSRDGTVRLWDSASGEEIRRYEGPGTAIFDVAFSPDGRFVLAGFGPDEQTGIADRLIDDPENCLAILWETDTGREMQRFVGHHGCINSVGFSPDGRVVVTASGGAHLGEPFADGSSKQTRDNSVRLWNVSTGETLARMDHLSSLETAAFSPDGRYLATGEWQLVDLWSVPPTLNPAAIDPLSGTGPLLISSNRDGDFNIYRINAAGAASSAHLAERSDGTPSWIQLTDDPAEDTGPAWSPDGRQIAFCSNRSGSLDIWLMNADGSRPVQLTDYPGIDRLPCWSPDGKRIAFVRHLSRDNWEIFVMNADGSEQTNLTNHPAKESDPAWSPDGRTIAYSCDSDGTHLYVMNADGSDRRLLSGRKGSFVFPAWSPDGTELAFTGWADEVGGDLELFVIRADGTGERQLTSLGGLNTFAAWSPDGQRIAFQHRYPNVPGRKAIVRVLDIDDPEPAPISGPEAHIGYGGGRPAWGPRAAAF
jgi:serine/threonine protein kinase/Tol biopolymer transport system component